MGEKDLPPPRVEQVVMTSASVAELPAVPGPELYALAAHHVLNRVGAALIQSRRLHSELGQAGHPASAAAETITRNLRGALAALEDLARGHVPRAGSGPDGPVLVTEV